MREAIAGYRVMVIDDYVDSGKSLNMSMEAIKQLGPVVTMGSCVAWNGGTRYMEPKHIHSSFKAFEI